MEIKDYFFKYLWVVTLLLIFGVCYFTAGTLNAYLASKYLLSALQPASAPGAAADAGAAANYHPDPGAIIKRNLFNIVIAVPGAGPEGNQPAAAPTLHAKLLGIIYFAFGSAWNRATVKLLDDNKSEVFKEGDEVKKGSGMVVEKLIRVRYASGQEEELSLEEEKKKRMAGVVPPEEMYIPDAAKLSPADRERALAEARKAMGVNVSNKIHKISEKEYVIEQALIQESLQNLNSLLQQARMVPNLVGEGDSKSADGFRIFRIQPESIFSQLGLHNGDVIKAINGVKMDTVERGLELLQQLRFQKNFTLDIGRQDQSMTISYRVE